MKFRSIVIEQERWGENKGKYNCKISFDINEDVSVYANANEIVTAELVKVLIPVFEKITNQKFEEVIEETETLLDKFKIRRKQC